MVDHGRHANGCASGNDPLCLAVLASVDEILFTSDSGRAMGNTRHDAQSFMDNGPKIRTLLEICPFEILGVDTLEAGHETLVNLGFV